MRQSIWMCACAAGTILLSACDSVVVGEPIVKPPDGAGASGGGGGSTNPIDNGVPGPDKSNKVDLLLVVDNSRGMANAQDILANTIPQFIYDLDMAGVTDVHIGVITSSLGGVGSDSCSGMVDPSENDGARLITRTASSVPADTYQDLGFLAWDPNQTMTPPGEPDSETIANTLGQMVVGAGEVGCGYESQLESFYRFLIDPDPHASLNIESNGDATLVGTDNTLLAQRASFLRPDSLLLIVMATEENDCSTRDGGQFWFSRQIYQPGTHNPYHLPPARAACATDPTGPCCYSCGQGPGEGCDDSADDCGGSLPPLEDSINLRCFDQKRRFGIDFLWPMDRYIAGLSSAQVADRHGNVVPNPLYAAGQRGSELVLFTGILGVPWQLLDTNPASAARTGQELTDTGRWSALIGDPANAVPASDPHMVESVGPRAGLAGPSSPHDADSAHGHEYSVPNQDDLQYACTFELPNPIDCEVTFSGRCYCTEPQNDNPVCQDPQTEAFGMVQYRGAANPGTRPLQLVQALAHRGIASSICPATTTDSLLPEWGYRPTFAKLVSLVTPRLQP
jgi:hypothetical protein